MCIIYKSVLWFDDFVNNALFLLKIVETKNFLVSSSFFGDIYKYVNEFINIKNEFINGMFLNCQKTFFLFESKSLYINRIL